MFIWFVISAFSELNRSVHVSPGKVKQEQTEAKISWDREIVWFQKRVMRHDPVAHQFEGNVCGGQPQYGTFLHVVRGGVLLW